MLVASGKGGVINKRVSWKSWRTNIQDTVMFKNPRYEVLLKLGRSRGGGIPTTQMFGSDANGERPRWKRGMGEIPLQVRILSLPLNFMR